MDSLRDRAAIVGIGQTPYSKGLGRSEFEAILAACADAGIAPREFAKEAKAGERYREAIVASSAIRSAFWSPTPFHLHPVHSGGGEPTTSTRNSFLE